MDRQKRTRDAARRGAYRRGGATTSASTPSPANDWAEEMGLRVPEQVIAPASDPTLQRGLFDGLPTANPKFLDGLRLARRHAPGMAERRALDAMIEEWER